MPSSYTKEEVLSIMVIIGTERSIITAMRMYAAAGMPFLAAAFSSAESFSGSSSLPSGSGMKNIRARREMINTGKIAYSAAAKNTYQGEVKSLMAKLNVALSNAPRERQAQVMANASVAAKRKENPDMNL